MRAVTLVFFAFATFCLGITATALGAASFLAGFLSVPETTATSALLGVTVGLSVVFLVLAPYFALRDVPRG